MPVPEALALGVPVICSDIASLREAGGNVPLYLDPLDGLGWQKAICDFTIASSVERQRQVKLLEAWRGPTWQDHMETVIDLIDRLNRDLA